MVAWQRDYSKGQHFPDCFQSLFIDRSIFGGAHGWSDWFDFVDIKRERSVTE